MSDLIRPESANTMISDRFEVFHVADPITDQTTYHTHDFFELHCVLEGFGQIYVDGCEYQLSPGTITLLSPSDLHRMVGQHSDFFERVYIFIDPTFLSTYSTSQSDLSQAFHGLGKSRSRFLQLPPAELRQHLAPLEQQPALSFGADLQYSQHLIDFVILINQLSLTEEPGLSLPATTTDDPAAAVMAYINENLEKDLRLDALAEHFFTDKYHLSRSFKKATGITLHRYVTKKRLLYSKQLLRREQSANAVYSLCGFRSYTHFLRSFKQEFQLTPKEFLQRVKDGQVIQYEHFENQ